MVRLEGRNLRGTTEVPWFTGVIANSTELPLTSATESGDRDDTEKTTSLTLPIQAWAAWMSLAAWRSTTRSPGR